MGYTTEFDGSVSISPPLNAHEIAYLRKFAASRLNGVIDAQGEDDDDRWRLVVTGNTVTSIRAD
jgi:hypothetical protein